MSDDAEPRPVREWVRTRHFLGSVALVLLVAGSLTGATLLAAPEGGADRADADAPRSTPVGVLRDGVYQVGVDIRPGRWSTPGPSRAADVGLCYWERATSGSGELADILANATLRGPASLFVEDREWLSLTGPCTWRRVSGT